jgi:hypothetical protein
MKAKITAAVVLLVAVGITGFSVRRRQEDRDAAAALMSIDKTHTQCLAKVSPESNPKFDIVGCLKTESGDRCRSEGMDFAARQFDNNMAAIDRCSVQAKHDTDEWEILFPRQERAREQTALDHKRRALLATDQQTCAAIDPAEFHWADGTCQSR